LPLTLSCQYNAPFVSSTVQFSRISPAARILAGNRRYVTTNAATLSTLFLIFTKKSFCADRLFPVTNNIVSKRRIRFNLSSGSFQSKRSDFSFLRSIRYNNSIPLF